MSNYIRFVRFNPRERKFLELYFSGWKMKDAARAAGYRGSTPQSLCNTGRKVLTKFGNNRNAFFRLAGPHEMKIARLISDTLDDDSKPRQLAALKILGRAFFP